MCRRTPKSRYVHLCFSSVDDLWYFINSRGRPNVIPTSKRRLDPTDGTGSIKCLCDQENQYLVLLTRIHGFIIWEYVRKSFLPHFYFRYGEINFTRDELKIFRPFLIFLESRSNSTPTVTLLFLVYINTMLTSTVLCILNRETYITKK